MARTSPLTGAIANIGQVSRAFDPTTARRYGRRTLLPNRLVIDSAKYDFSKLMYFQFMPGRTRPLWVDKRSIVVAIDGACRGNNSSDPNSRASYGVYFGKTSPHNRRGCLDPDFPQTSSRAEIEGAIQAVEMIAKLDLTGENTTRVILKTDSDYLFKSMTEWIYNWVETGGVRPNNEKVKHWTYLLALHRRIMEVESAKGLRIQFWWVPREFNRGSDALANLALDREDSAYGSS
jgi:ribonuclease HI